MKLPQPVEKKAAWYRRKLRSAEEGLEAFPQCGGVADGTVGQRLHAGRDPDLSVTPGGADQEHAHHDVNDPVERVSGIDEPGSGHSGQRAHDERDALEPTHGQGPVGIRIEDPIEAHLREAGRNGRQVGQADQQDECRGAGDQGDAGQCQAGGHVGPDHQALETGHAAQIGPSGSQQSRHAPDAPQHRQLPELSVQNGLEDHPAQWQQSDEGSAADAVEALVVEGGTAAVGDRPEVAPQHDGQNTGLLLGNGDFSGRFSAVRGNNPHGIRPSLHPGGRALLSAHILAVCSCPAGAGTVSVLARISDQVAMRMMKNICF